MRDGEIGKKDERYADAVDRILARVNNLMASAGVTLNTSTPCAGCKLLRRRCAQDCPFSPYFPPHEPQKFASVHKVFGASNVSKMLTEVPEAHRADAANSLVYEANVRLRDPVNGCMGAITALQRRIQLLEAELAAVRAEILKHKYMQAGGQAAVLAHTSSQIHHHLLATSSDVSATAAPSPPRPMLAAVRTPASSVNMYPPASSSSTDYSSITNENIPYFLS